MARRPPRESEPDDNQSSEMEGYLASILTEAGFELALKTEIAEHVVTIVAHRSDLGKDRRYGIQVNDSDVRTADADVARALISWTVVIH